MVKLTIGIEAGTSSELEEVFRKLSEPPAVEIDGHKFAKLATEAGGIKPRPPSIVNGVPANER